MKVFAVLSWDSGFFFSSPLPQLSLVIPSCSHIALNLGPVLPSSFDMIYIGPGAYSFSFALVTDSQIAPVSINKTRCSPHSACTGSQDQYPELQLGQGGGEEIEHKANVC